jgi:hypothetical protein
MFRKYLWPLLAALMAVSLLAFTACSDDDDDSDDGDAASAEEIAAVEEVVAAILATDPTDQSQVDFWLAHMSDEVLEGFFGTTRDDCAAEAEECIGEGAEAESFEGTSVTGDTARTTVTDADGGTFTLALALEEETWVISEIRFGPAEVPAGVTAIDVQLNEYAFGFNRSSIEDGNIAFPFENIGEEAHELVILQTNEDFDVNEVIAAYLGEEGEDGGEDPAASPSADAEEEGGSPEDELPPGVDNLYFGGIAGPGGGGIAVFEEPLEPGTYTLICLFPDPEGTPHAELGMTADFEVPAE